MGETLLECNMNSLRSFTYQNYMPTFNKQTSLGGSV